VATEKLDLETVPPSVGRMGKPVTPAIIPELELSPGAILEDRRRKDRLASG
jgi:hypothetical protein